MFLHAWLRLALIALPASAPESRVGELLRAHREADRALAEGRLPEARAGFLRCLELDPGNPFAAYGVACGHAREGEVEPALEWLELAVRTGYADARVAEWDEDLAGLRGHPGFGEALRRMRVRTRDLTDERFLPIHDPRPGADRMCAAAIDPGGTRVAVGLVSGRIALLDARNGRELGVAAQLGHRALALALRTTDGVSTVFAVIESGELFVLPGGGARTRIPIDAEPSGERPGGDLAIDPTGERLWASTARGSAILVTTAGDLIRRFELPRPRCGSHVIAWSADGVRLAIGRGKRVELLDGATGEVAAVLETRSGVDAVAFDPTGRWLATGHEDGWLRVWDAASREPRVEKPPERDFFGDVLSVRELAFSPSGQSLACSTAPAVHVHVYATGTWERVREGPFQGGRMGESVPLAWSADGSRLWSAYAGGISLRELDPASPRSTLLLHGLPPRSSTAGLALVDHGHGVGVLDERSGRVRWSRVALAGGGWLLQAGNGVFDTDLDALGDLRLLPSLLDRGVPEIPLADVAPRLFDPKRLRAAAAGIPLVARHPERAPAELVRAVLARHAQADGALRSGDLALALEAFLACLELDPENPILAYGLASAAARSGAEEPALEWLERALEWGYRGAGTLAGDEDLATLRATERFQRVLDSLRALDAGAAPSPPVLAASPAWRPIPVEQADLVVQVGRVEHVRLDAQGVLHFSGAAGVGLGRVRERALLVDPGGQRLVASVGPGATWLFTTAGSRIRRIELDGESASPPLFAWSPDGARLACAHAGRLWRVDGRTGKPVGEQPPLGAGAAAEGGRGVEPESAPHGLTALAYDPSGRWLWTGHGDGSVRRLDAETLEQELRWVPDAERAVRALLPSPDGRHLARLHVNEVEIVEVDGGRALVSAPVSRSDHPPLLAWSDDSSRLWMAAPDGLEPIVELLVLQGTSRPLFEGSLPVRVDAQLALSEFRGSTVAFDPSTGEVLWTRVNAWGDGVLVLPGGWVAGHPSQVAAVDLWVAGDDGVRRPMPLAEHAMGRFDPKRVRVELAGAGWMPRAR